MANTQENDIPFNSFFSQIVKDNNGKTVTDVNAGLVNLYSFFNDEEHKLIADQAYLVSKFEEHFPDLVAMTSLLTKQDYWWWILLLNRLDNPLEELKENWVYSIINPVAVNSLITDSNTNKQEQTTSRIGSIVELN